MTEANALLYSLFGGAATVLGIALITARILQRIYSPDGSNSVIKNLNSRIQSWMVIVVLMSVSLFLGSGWVILAAAICSFAALRELLTQTVSQPADHMATGAAFFVVLPVQYLFVWYGWQQAFSLFIPVFAFILLPALSAFRGKTDAFLLRVSEIYWALMISVYCVSYAPALSSLDIPGYSGMNMLLFAFLFISAQSSDVCQYIWGKLYGRTQIAPVLSPGKTAEGLIGGCLSASLIGASLWLITPFTPLQSGLLALMIALLGTLGGLILSAVKRDRGVKDWGHSISGHGGFLDRLDSLIFSAPVFFYVVKFGWT